MMILVHLCLHRDGLTRAQLAIALPESRAERLDAPVAAIVGRERYQLGIAVLKEGDVPAG